MSEAGFVHQLEAGAARPTSPSPTALSATEWGMVSFLLSEVAFFSTLIVTYLTYVGKDRSGPTPAILSLPLVIGTTICLLSSSGTVHLAERALRRGAVSTFALCWSLTILLGVIFLLGTAYEWYGLIFRDHLTIGAQSVRHDLLHARRFSRISRDVRVNRAVDRARSGASPRGVSAPRDRRGTDFLVLALCRRRVGGRVHRGLSGGKVTA